MILNKTLKRIRQILAAIAEEKIAKSKEERLMLSWQTRSLAMVMAASGANPSDEIMQFAANLTIDNEEYEEFKNDTPAKAIKPKSRVPVHATTQDEATKKNFEAAADRNNLDMAGLFGLKLSEGKPGHN